MLPTFPYAAMTVTGILHIISGVAVGINAVIGLSWTREDYWILDGRVIKIYLGVGLGSSFWMIMVGILGVLTGVKREEDRKTHSLKVAYMVTAILSAVIFSLSALSVSSRVNLLLRRNHWLGIVGILASLASFVLSIVSSSICCCCANSSADTSGVVIVQNQGPPGTYPPGTYPPGTYPPGTYPQGTYPPGTYQPGTYPPGTYPPQPYPAGQAYPGFQSPEQGVVNPGYNVNAAPPEYKV